MKEKLGGGKRPLKMENKRLFNRIWYNVIDLQESGAYRDDYKSLVVYHSVNDCQLVCVEVGWKALSHRLGVFILGGRDFGRHGFLLYGFRLVRFKPVTVTFERTALRELSFFGTRP